MGEEAKTKTLRDAMNEALEIAPARACKTCAFAEGFSDYRRCGATGFYCQVERRSNGPCGHVGRLWRPKAPRIGLLGFIKRIFVGDTQ